MYSIIHIQYKYKQLHSYVIYKSCNYSTIAVDKTAYLLWYHGMASTVIKKQYVVMLSCRPFHRHFHCSIPAHSRLMPYTHKGICCCCMQAIVIISPHFCPSGLTRVANGIVCLYRWNDLVSLG